MFFGVVLFGLAELFSDSGVILVMRGLLACTDPLFWDGADALFWGGRRDRPFSLFVSFVGGMLGIVLLLCLVLSSKIVGWMR